MYDSYGYDTYYDWYNKDGITKGILENIAEALQQ